MGHEVEKAQSKGGSAVIRASARESLVDHRERARAPVTVPSGKRGQHGKGEKAQTKLNSIGGTDPEIEVDITQDQPTMEQRAAYDRFWQMVLERLITQREFSPPESIDKQRE